MKEWEHRFIYLTCYVAFEEHFFAEGADVRGACFYRLIHGRSSA